ncbi:cytochrome P450 [Butyriboletus roseoflavus]|nr:cytochrome P450 [Butyriboletus roseoflavus]
MIDGISLESLQALLAGNLRVATAYRPRFIDVACALGALYAVPPRHPTRPPPTENRPLFLDHPIPLSTEKWAEEYGGVYEVAWTLGGRRIVLCDPKAIAHFYGGEPWTYILTPFGQLVTEKLVGKGILSAKGESHRRQRKTLTPAFSNAAIRNLTSVFYDSAYKAKSVWDSLIDSDGGGSTVIEVQNCLDTVGIAGFSHDFGSLDGKPASVTEVFDSFGNTKAKRHKFLILLAQTLPWLLNLPTSRSKLIQRLNDTMGDIANVLLMRSKKEKEAGTLGETEEKSIIGLLIRSENQGSQLHLAHEEVVSQAKVLLLAGYETTSSKPTNPLIELSSQLIVITIVSLTWALIELSKNGDIQTKLRAEILKFGADPTYDQLANNLPYLDAVAAEDDIIPLSKPVRTRSGKLVDHISVAKGTFLSVSVPSINRSTALWGADAKEFKPERWIGDEGIPAAAKEVQGHRHLLTFIDGPRTCLGKGFAITEFKIVLSILVKNFVFELPGGPGTVIEMVRGILPRPKVAGEEGSAVPLLVDVWNTSMLFTALDSSLPLKRVWRSFVDECDLHYWFTLVRDD